MLEDNFYACNLCGQLPYRMAVHQVLRGISRVANKGWTYGLAFPQKSSYTFAGSLPSWVSK